MKCASSMISRSKEDPQDQCSGDSKGPLISLYALESLCIIRSEPEQSGSTAGAVQGGRADAWPTVCPRMIMRNNECLLHEDKRKPYPASRSIAQRLRLSYPPLSREAVGRTGDLICDFGLRDVVGHALRYKLEVARLLEHPSMVKRRSSGQRYDR